MLNLFLYILIFLNSVNFIDAASFGGVGVFPSDYVPGKAGSQSRFELELYPGEDYSNSIKITNTTGSDQTYILYSADGVTTRDGAYALEPEQANMQHIGSWTKLSKNEVFVPNESEVEVPFTINIPKGVESGDYLGGISVYEKGAGENNGEGDGIQLQIRKKVGVRIYVTIPGELKKSLDLTKFEAGLDKEIDKVSLKFGLKNDGNVRIEPKGNIKVINYFTGSEIENFPIDLRIVLPNNPTEVPIVWKDSPWFGRYIVKAQVEYGDKVNEVVEKEVEITYITNKAKVVLLILSIFILIFITSLVKKATSSKIKR